LCITLTCRFVTLIRNPVCRRSCMNVVNRGNLTRNQCDKGCHSGVPITPQPHIGTKNLRVGRRFSDILVFKKVIFKKQTQYNISSIHFPLHRGERDLRVRACPVLDTGVNTPDTRKQYFFHTFPSPSRGEGFKGEGEHSRYPKTIFLPLLQFINHQS